MRPWIIAGALALVLVPARIVAQVASAPSAASPQSPAADTASTASADAPVNDLSPTLAPPKPWKGTLAEGFEEMKRLAGRQQLESARTVADDLLEPNAFLRWKAGFAARGGWRKRVADAADPVLDAAGWNGLDPSVRAEVWYAKGVIASLAKDRETAEAALWKARGMSSDPTLQRDAVYDLGVLALQAGEEARAKLPEISGKPAQPALAPPAAGAQPGAAGQAAAAGAAQPPDPLQVARAAYLEARDRFVERLASEWNDADTQANVELCLKRLRQLDDIEKKRKEDEQKKKDQQKKDQDKKDQDKKKDDKQDDKKDTDKKDTDKKDTDKKDAGKQDQSKDDSKKDQQKKKDDEKKDEKPQEPKDEKDKDAEKNKKKDAQPTEAKEGEMSPAEMTQLFDRLQRIEDEARKIQAQLKAARRSKVKKDW